MAIRKLLDELPQHEIIDFATTEVQKGDRRICTLPQSLRALLSESYVIMRHLDKQARGLMIGQLRIDDQGSEEMKQYIDGAFAQIKKIKIGMGRATLLSDMFWQEVSEEYPHDDDEYLEVRKGWVLVAVKREKEPEASATAKS